MANRNRTAGNSYERKIVNEVKALTGETFVTSRAESRNMDNLGVDVFNPKHFNPRLLPLIVFHNKVEKSTKNFISTGEYVIMEKREFYSIVQSIGGCPYNIQCKITSNNPDYDKIIKFYNTNK